MPTEVAINLSRGAIAGKILWKPSSDLW